VNRSTKRANDVNDYSESLRLRIKELEFTVKQLQEQVVDLEVDLEEKSNKLAELDIIMAAQELAPAVIQQIEDPKKALSDYASAVDGKFSWGQTSEDEHIASIGKNATNDPAESPFAQLTRQLQCYGRVLGIHASAVGHARINGDFKRDINNSSNDGAYFKLSPEERQSLLAYALCASPAVRREEKVQLDLDAQREAKNQKQKLLREKKMLACQKEYANKLMYIEMANSPAFWKTVTNARNEYKKLDSNNAKLNAVKEQI
jgi:hypothetical protein